MTVMSLVLSPQDTLSAALLARTADHGMVTAPAKQRREIHGGCAIALQQPASAVGDSAVSVYHDAATGRLLVVLGRIFNRKEIDVAVASGSREPPSAARSVADAIEKWGAQEALRKLRGQFVVILHNARSQTLLAARDLFGTLPLYFTLASGAIALASLAKQLIPLHAHRPEPDDALVWRYLMGDVPSSGIFSGESTFFKSISRVKAGHLLKYTEGRVSQEAYCDPAALLLDPEAPRPDPQEYLRLLGKVVREQAGDYEGVGSALSGGLDSTALAMLLNKANPRSSALPTVSLDVAGRDEDENIRAVLAQIRAQPAWVPTDGVDMFSLFEETAVQQEAPSLSPSTALFHLLKKVARKNGIDVLFSGLGADEVLGGMNLGYLADLFRSGHWWRAYRELCAYTAHDSMHYGRSKLRVFRQHVVDPMALVPRPRRIPRWINPDFARAHLDDPEERPRRAGIRDSVFVTRTLDKLTRSFTQTFLHCEIHNAASSGIEHRFPFLDPRIVGYALRLPWHERINGGIYKVHHRKAFAGLLPDGVLRQERKSYIPHVHDRWLCETYRPQVDALVLDPNARYGRYLDRRAVAEEHRQYTREADFARRNNLRRSTWRALSLELWLRAFWA